MKKTLVCVLSLAAPIASAGDFFDSAPGPVVAPTPTVVAPAPPWRRDALGPALDFMARAQLASYADADRFVGNDRGWAATAISLRKGGFAVVGTLAERPVVVRLDKAGKELWRSDLTQKGFATFEAASVLELSDGSLVASVLAYRTPSSAANAHFTRLSPEGKPQWTRALRFAGHDGSPFPLVMKAGKGDAVLLRGHVGVGGERYAWWEGRLDGAGRVTHDVQLDVMEPGFRTFHYARMEPTQVE